MQIRLADDKVAIATVARHNDDDFLGDSVKLHGPRHGDTNIDGNVHVRRFHLVLCERGLHLGALFLREVHGPSTTFGIGLAVLARFFGGLLRSVFGPLFGSLLCQALPFFLLWRPLLERLWSSLW